MTTGVAFAANDAEVRQLKILYQLLARLSQSGTLDEVYETTIASLLEATGAASVAILLFDDDGVMRFKSARGLTEESRRSLAGYTPWTRGQRDASIIARDANGGESRVWVPLALDAGVFGQLLLCYSAQQEFKSVEGSIAQAIASHAALAIDRKRAEFALIHAEEQLRAILDYSPAVVFLKDLDGRYIFVNRRHRELFGNQTQLIGRTDFEIFPLESAAQFHANDRAVIEAGEPISLEEYALQEDGIHTYVSVKFPLRNSDGSISGVCGIATDITERKALETASRRLAAIVESSADIIISQDNHGVITSWNAAAERTFGYTAAEMLGKSMSALALPERAAEAPSITARIRKGETVRDFETVRRRKDGVLIDVALTVSPLRDASGAIVGASGLARDITELKRAEEERARLLEREREAHRTAELLNQVGSRLVAQLDIEKLVQEVTDVATVLVGAQLGAFFHTAVNENGEAYTPYALSGVSHGGRAAFAELFDAAFRRDEIVRGDDTAGPVRSYLAAPVIARSGEVIGGLLFGHAEPAKFTESHESIVAGIAAQAAIALDNARLFEETRTARADLTRSNDDLRRANRDLEVFAYSASHDLQEPLRNITITAQLLERNWTAGAHASDDALLRNILSASRRMTDLTRDLLAYTEATRWAEGPVPAVNSAEVLAGVLDNMQAPIDDAGVRVTAGSMPSAAIHPSRLAQLFQNLVGNAIKYRRQEEPFIHVAGVEEDGWCIFSVTDNGIGIEPQYAQQIFQLFKRLHGRDRYPGSGIGLGICQRLVEQHGGRIWLEQSTPGEGSTFCFSVPCAAG